VNERRGEGVWLLIFLALLLFAKPAADAATPPHHHKPKRSSGPLAKVVPPSWVGRADIPPLYLALYQRSARTCPGLPWGVLAGIGKVETNHGRSTLPGVRSGVNAFGCCAGPMQFNIRNGPPSTWDRYGRGGNVYDPQDAIPAAAWLLCANSIRTWRGSDPCPGVIGTAAQHHALLRYNAACWYIDQVLSLARRYQGGR
jgi:hypothetical protein